MKGVPILLLLPPALVCLGTEEPAAISTIKSLSLATRSLVIPLKGLMIVSDGDQSLRRIGMGIREALPSLPARVLGWEEFCAQEGVSGVSQDSGELTVLFWSNNSSASCASLDASVAASAYYSRMVALAGFGQDVVEELVSTHSKSKIHAILSPEFIQVMSIITLQRPQLRGADTREGIGRSHCCEGKLRRPERRSSHCQRPGCGHSGGRGRRHQVMIND